MGGGGRGWAVLETDVGVWMDDTFALQALLEGVGGLRLAAAVASCGGSSQVLMKHLRRAGWGGVPVGEGPKCPGLLPSALSGWGADENPDEYPGGYSRNGSQLLAETIHSVQEREGPEAPPVIVLVLGPPSATAEMLRIYPDIAAKVRVVSMMGSLRPNVQMPWGSLTPIAEYNVRLDVPATRSLLSASWTEPVAIAEVGSTIQLRFDGADYQRLRRGAAENPTGGAALFMEQYEHWVQTCRANETMRCHAEADRIHPAQQTPVMFDVGALALAENFPGMMISQKNLTISDRGILGVSTNGSGSPVQIASDWSSGEDVEAFKAAVIDSLVPPPRHNGWVTLEIELILLIVLILASILGGFGWFYYYKRHARKRYVRFDDAFQPPSDEEDQIK